MIKNDDIIKTTFKKTSDWVSSKGARSVQYMKSTHLQNPSPMPDSNYQCFISLGQSCMDKSVSVSISRLTDRGDGVFLHAENPYAGISLEPDELTEIIKTMKELQR